MKRINSFFSFWNSRPSLTVVLLVSIFLASYYDFVLLHPNRFTSAAGGDALKTFFVAADYVKHQPFSTECKGMNYPYGLSYIYTDGELAIAAAIKAVSAVFPWVGDHTVGILNLLFLASYLGGAVLLSQILKRLGVSNAARIFGAIAIILLSPQIDRYNAHPTLAYVIFFPLSWFLLLWFMERKTVFRGSLLILNSVFWFFVHPYYQMMTAMFYFVIWAVALIRPARKRDWRQQIFFFFFLVVVPVAITQGYSALTDHHGPRPQIPGGFYDYYASPNSVFAAIRPPLNGVFAYFFHIKTSQQNWEGWAYIGLIPLLALLLAIFRWGRKIWRQQYRAAWLVRTNPFLKNSLIASGVLLLFAMCVPFRWGFDTVLDWFPFIKQFRALGRFAWPFYYVAGVFGIYTLELLVRKYRGLGLRLLANTLLAGALFLYLSEAFPYHRNMRTELKKLNVFEVQNLDDDMRQAIGKVNEHRQEYQCLVPIPFFHIGDEEFEWYADENTQRLAMAFSYWCGIPQMSSASARASIDEAKTLQTFFAPDWMDKPIRHLVDPRRKFLIVDTRGDYNEYERDVLSKGHTLYSCDRFELKEVTYEALFAGSDKPIRIIDTADCYALTDTGMALLSASASFPVSPNEFVVRHFDEKRNEPAFLGAGSRRGIIREYTHLVDKEPLHLVKGREYSISCWYYYSKEKCNQNTLVVQEENDAGDLKWIGSASGNQPVLQVGNWLLLETRFTPEFENDYISVFFKGKDEYAEPFFVDELMIRPSATSVITLVPLAQAGKMLRCRNTVPVDTVRGDQYTRIFF